MKPEEHSFLILTSEGQKDMVSLVLETLPIILAVGVDLIHLSFTNSASVATVDTSSACLSSRLKKPLLKVEESSKFAKHPTASYHKASLMVVKWDPLQLPHQRDKIIKLFL